VGGCVHVKGAIPIYHLRGIGHESGKFIFWNSRTFQRPVHQILRTPAPDILIGTVEIVFSVIAQYKRIRKVAPFFDRIAVSIHRLTLSSLVTKDRSTFSSILS
jgi:hypothetical protein